MFIPFSFFYQTSLPNVSTGGSGSIYFLGTTTSRITTSGSSDTTFQFGTGSFTIEWWQNLSAGAGSFPRVFEQSVDQWFL
jgi:hypothetical protein